MGGLDALRLLAALSVALYHFTSREWSFDPWGTRQHERFPRLAGLSIFGAYGVDLFFLISGFVIIMTAWNRDVGSFAASRVARLFPAYWVSVIAATFLFNVVWRAGSGGGVSLQVFAGNMTMMQSAVGLTSVSGSFWTLWAELRFYFLVGILVATGLNERRLVVFIGAWAPLAGVAQQAGFGFVSELLVAPFSPLFAAGMALFLLHRNRKSLLLWLLLLENLAFALAWTAPYRCEVLNTATDGIERVTTTTSAIAIVVCFAFIMVMVLTSFGTKSWPRIASLAAITYPLYLIHDHWGPWLISELHSKVPAYALVVCVIVLLGLVAYGIHRGIERPLGRRLRRALLAVRARPGVPG